MAIEHVDIPDGERHEPKGISSAAVNTIYTADGVGSGEWELPSGLITTQVIVREAADFPTPVANVITLAANTNYVIDGAVSIGDDTFIMSSNSTITGHGAAFSSITTTTTGNVFTSATSFTLDNFALNASSATVFACTGGAYESAYLTKLTINTCSVIGAFTSWYSLFWDQGAVVLSASPLTMGGACNTFILDLVSFISGYTTAIDLDSATFSTCSFNRCGFSNASATNHIIIAANSANINAGQVGRFTGNTFNSSATNIVTNSSVGDLRWKYLNNFNLATTAKAAQAYMHTSNVTALDVGDGDAGNPKLINGSTNWVSYLADQFTITTGGRFTYTGVNSTEFTAMAHIIGTCVSSSQTIAFYIAKNGTIITASKTQREFSSTAIGSPSPTEVIVSLDTGDYVEVYIENLTGVIDFTSTILNVLIGEV